MAAEQDLTFLQGALGLRCSGLDGRLETSPSLNYNAIQAHDSVSSSDSGIFLIFPFSPHMEDLNKRKSSMWMPAAPFSMNILASFIVAVMPPWPVSASAMMGFR